MSTRFPVVTAKELLAALQRAGFQIERQRGSHIRLSHKDDPARQTTIPFHRGTIPLGTLKGILSDTEITLKDLKTYLGRK